MFYWDCLRPYQDGDEVWKRYAPTAETMFTFHLLSGDELDVKAVDEIAIQYRLFKFLAKKKKKKRLRKLRIDL